MFIIFILIILAILMAILSAIYSVFTPFIQNIGNVVNFNSAYYGAIGGVERGHLILKYKKPGFEGSGGFLDGKTFGPESDNMSGNFGLLKDSQNGFAWIINSRTNKIPNPGQGNVDYLISNGTDSKDYNKLPYYNSEKIILGMDDTKLTDMYYTGTINTTSFTGGYFTGIIRLPPKAQTMFGKNLCDTCDNNGDGIADDIVVSRMLDGNYNGVSFAIVPSISIFYYSGGIVDSNKDIAIRKKVINDTGFLDFGINYGFSPLIYPNTITEHNVLSLDSNTIKGIPYANLLDGSNSVTGLKLGFGIVNLLRTEDDDIYPFLEYQFSFPTPVADNFFTLQGIGLVGDYNVKIFIKKSTNEHSSIGDFTIIF